MLRFLFVTVLCNLLLSCQDNNKGHYVVGVSQCSDDLWRETVNAEMQREVVFYKDLSLIIKTVKDDTQKQIQDISNFIEQGVDLLVVSPNESSLLTPIVEEAMQRDIPVILLDRKIDSDRYTAYVGADNYQLAKELAIYVTDLLGGKGNIVVMRGLEGSTADKDRYRGFMEIIHKFPDINIVAQGNGQFLKKEAEEEMSRILKKDIPIDLVFAMNDPMAYGVHDAMVRYSGTVPYIVGIDALAGEDGGIEAIENGKIDASFIYPTGGDKVIELAHKILNKEEYKKENVLYTAVIDRNNARILQLQHAQISEQQNKFDKINALLDKSISQYSNQKILFYMSLIVILLVSVILIFAIFAYRSKSKTNTKLRIQNRRIRKQSEELEKQTDELLILSKQLEKATNDKLVFFTNISHEFKTPLSLILGPINMLLDSVEDKKQIELLNLVKRNSNRLLQLISEIIEFRTYDNDKIKINFVEEDLILFIKNITEYFYSYKTEKQVEVIFDIADDVFILYFDKEKMEKIYFNLLSNAFRHVNKQGSITVSIHKKTKEGSDYAELSVHNTGSFIPEEEQKNVFGRFYVLDNEMGNTGIGLALVSMMLEVHGGTIEVKSSSEDGTSFIALIPFVQESKNNSSADNFYKIGSYSESKIEAEKTVKEQAYFEQHIKDDQMPLLLIVDDNADMRQFIRLTLQDTYNIIEAYDGEDGIEKALKYIPDLIISDVMMPRKDGFEVGAKLRENVSTSHIPIIMLTACSLDEQKAKGFESGADAYIPKPFNETLLKVRVRKLIENREIIKKNFGINLMSVQPKESLAKKEQKFIDKFSDYIELNISDSALSVEDIAKHMGLSKSQLYRKLKSLTDYSPNELIRVVRLKAARNILLKGMSSVSEVAYLTGFSSPSYFTKCYKELYGESPSEVASK